MSGPKLEETLNNAVSTLGAKRAYTCGHFPQSFEYSSVGGWAVTRGAGQNSSYYGKIEDIVISQEYVTPIGIIKSDEFPRNATGSFHRPDHDGQRGNLRHSYSCHPQSFQVYAREP